ncbi:MAG: hypothetical protein HYV65_01640 [Candidatus Spechtbacteria bacterium]|nr:hypothetical protein [Candidatus Spechtbacteria bacterium]
MNKNQHKEFVILDSNALVHRAYHALPPLTAPDGELVNAVYGFTAILLKVLKEFNPDYVAAAFDMAAPTFRSKEYREYKAKRVKAPDELYNQIPRVKDVLSAFHIPVYEHEGFEGDDIIGTLVAQAPKKHQFTDLEIIIVTGDMDALQLVNKYTRVFTMRKGINDTVLYGEKEVFERYGLKPDQLADYRGLRGDPSDNIIGVPGIGEKTAMKLLHEFITLEGLYEAIKEDSPASIKPRILELLRTHKDDAFFSKMLATIRIDAPVKFSLPASRWKNFDANQIQDLFKQLGFSTLFRRITELGVDGQAITLASAQVKKTKQGSLFGVEKEPTIQEKIEEEFKQGVFSKQIYDLEINITPVLQAMQKRGIRLDVSALQKIEKDISANIGQLEKKIFDMAGGEFNINSPQQLSNTLFEKLGISSKGVGKTPGGEISTSAPELERISDGNPIIALVLEYRELQKLLSTYLLPLPTLMAKDGRIHTTFNQLGTTTGRISSSNPNLQNIPLHTNIGAGIRSAFIPAQGKKFLSADYSQMELRVIAHLAHDEEMIAAFGRGEDIHTHTAARVFGVDEKDVTKEMRFRAKSLNFGLIYGMGVRAFARRAKISNKDASDFVDKYMLVFKGVTAYMENTKRFVRQHGYVETLWGRKRFIPDIDSRDPRIRKSAERAAINMPVQGTSADIVKLAMVRAEKEFPGLALLLQVHDELLWEADDDIIQKRAQEIRLLLESIVELSVPLTVDLKVGESWGEMQSIS